MIFNTQAIINFKNNQKGAILPLVLILLLFMTILGTAALNIAMNQNKLLNVSAQHDTALYNAEKGSQKYLWMLNDDSQFYTGSNYSIVEDDNKHTIYQSDQSSTEPYRVQIIVAKQQLDDLYIPVTHRVIIRSTGWVPTEPQRLRTIEVTAHQRTFTQHGMVTNGEVSENGETLFWVTGEKFYGPLHTNGTLHIVTERPTFYGPVTYSQGIDINRRNAANYSSIFRQGSSQADSLQFPPNNNNLLAHARIDGHYYNGRTCIMLKGDSYDVRCWDKDDNTWKYNNVAYTYEPPSDYNNKKNEAGTYKTTRHTYYSFAEFRASIPSLEFPHNGIIYVNGTYGDEGNNGETYAYKFDKDYGNIFISGKLQGKLTIVSANDIYITGYDPCDWRHPDNISQSTGGITYATTTFTQVFENGDWVRTKVGGSSGEDMLGLVANHRIRIAHYNWPSQENSNHYWTNYYYNYWTGHYSTKPIDVAPYNITIHAALYVKDLSYGFEAYDQGNNKGTITMVGAIAQQFRGAVGTTAPRGYLKNYSHDPRMLYEDPCHFVEPANIGWQVGNWRETSSDVPEP